MSKRQGGNLPWAIARNDRPWKGATRPPSPISTPRAATAVGPRRLGDAIVLTGVAFRRSRGPRSCLQRTFRLTKIPSRSTEEPRKPGYLGNAGLQHEETASGAGQPDADGRMAGRRHRRAAGQRCGHDAALGRR